MLRETRYAYPVGRIRVAETHMLDRSRLERLIEAQSVEDALRTLYEAGYPEAEGYEEVLKAENHRLYDYLREISPEPEVFSMFLYKNDCHNIKVLLKNEFLGTENESILVDNGVFDINQLKVMISEREFKKLPDVLTEAINYTIDIFSRTKDPQIIDILIDAAYFKLFNSISKKTKNKYLIDIAKIMIDIANINAFVRIKVKMEDLELLSKVLVPGGRIELDDFSKWFSESIETFREAISRTPYGVVTEKAFGENGSMTQFEKACDDYLMTFLRKYKNKTFGIEPLVGYMFGKETELKNVRIILVGKINGINSDIIRERLRISYV